MFSLVFKRISWLYLQPFIQLNLAAVNINPVEWSVRGMGLATYHALIDLLEG